MNCPICEHYKDGKGEKDCLRCKQYLFFMLKSGKRQPIIFEHIPESIYENIADSDIDDRMPLLIDAIRRLPMELSMILSAYYILGINQEGIAVLLNLSKATVCRKLADSIQMLKELCNKKAPV
jgi:DNA-directed RNA polymerase specialized sigma subunit